MLGAIIHADALLGYIGVRNRSEIFTWGSVLGLQTETYIAFLPLAGDVPFNVWSLAGPFVAVWLSVLALYVLADGLKILLGNYVYRRA